MSEALSRQHDFPKPDHSLSTEEIVSAIEANPEHIESCNECGDPRGRDETMDEYVWVWPIHALISNNGESVRGAGDWNDRFLGLVGSRKIAEAIAKWRKRQGVPGHRGESRWSLRSLFC